jgi:hypothetical protein
MMQNVQLIDKLPSLSNQELRDIISECESEICEGTAKIEDYEAFVLCQQELVRRTWS